MLDKLEAIYERFHYLEERLSDPELVGDMEKFRKVNKEYKDLQDLVTVYKSYKELLGNIKTAREMLGEKDADMKEMAEMELQELMPRREQMEEEIKIMLIVRMLSSKLELGQVGMRQLSSLEIYIECIQNFLRKRGS